MISSLSKHLEGLQKHFAFELKKRDETMYVLAERINSIAKPKNLEEKLERCIEENKCTYLVTNKNYTPQKFYSCVTCNIGKGNGFCESCKNICHKGHKVQEYPHNPKGCFCDCGGGKTKKNCECCFIDF